ncbi:Sulfite efflux pump SSU1 [Pseudocercospora fuligena]|uniref:Sulfite efflux pump SSU1 n=1 Tax=Pseudocercospora fuligena TaxID=685502 RepID=A0A8H6RFB9_9PEZI|nr:Sulfite efflux pump SSU1 [Pseudocercospora fuligena]
MNPALSGVCKQNYSGTTPCAKQQQTTCKNQRGWRRIVRNFTPSWFSVNMGTGITSILLHNLPYNVEWLQYISYIIFALNVLLFVIFLSTSILRYVLYPKIWSAMIRHPAQSLFLGTLPMGLATIINMVVFVCVPKFGGDFWKLAWPLWWIDAAISLACCLYLPFILMTQHHHSVQSMTAAWLLPIVSTIVAAASGGIVAEILPNDDYGLITLITSYVLWATGVPLAMAVIVIYFLRLTTVSLPSKEVVVSSFLPLGPLGQGGFGIMQLGKVALRIFASKNNLPEVGGLEAGQILYVLGFLIGIIMWGFGLVWLTFAIATIARSKRFPFNMGWWGFTFPLGVYTVCTTTLGQELPSAFFRIVGTALSIAVALLWTVVSIGTVWRASTGVLFFAPCLKDVEGKEEEARKYLEGETAKRNESVGTAGSESV